MKGFKKNKKWILQYQTGNAFADAAVASISKELSVSEIMAKLLYVRGYRTSREAHAFLCQEEAQFHDPFLLKDMEKGIERISRALERDEKIAIYGDYDVDGVTSVSLLYLYLTALGADVSYYIPCRTGEGYGLSIGAIDILKKRGVSLMITVDTGITAIEEINYARRIGIDTVVTDHHECRPELPDACAVINPHREDDPYPFKELAGVGVIFKVVCAYEMHLCKKAGISEFDGVRRICREYADLVAIGTIADVMPVVDENRLIVTLGLRILESTERPGLLALIDAATSAKPNASKYPPKKRKINSSFIGFVIAPRINAAGRVSTAEIAVELLLSTDKEKATKLAKELCDLNLTRQVEENRIAELAYKKIDECFDSEKDRVIVIEDDTWQQGIIGIVSSRITEKYGVPSILISFDGTARGYTPETDTGKGSGRSVKGLNLVEALADSEELLDRFGGHELAAGLTIRRRNIDAFRKKINEYAASRMTDDANYISVEVDCAVEMKDLTLHLAQEIDRMEPFGTSNAAPVFMLSGAKLQKIVPLGEGKHTKMLLEKDNHVINAIWFGMNPSELPFEIGDTVDVLFQLNVNVFQNVTSLQMLVQDLRLTPSFEESFSKLRQRYLEIRDGAPFTEEENVLPSRDDIAIVYTALRHEYQLNHSYFPIRRLLGLHALKKAGLGYIKVEMILRIMQELQICEVTEPTEDCFIFDFYFNPTKTSIEKSSILKKLRSQQKRNDHLL
ncbi:MAG: single-stranded-DNA-specific exonuclease RecJ [Ruminococcaceae bacterium]|nr:single-stranded-DNA-specific exonuclease RecJ [Oscillospiraceae bacterium]